MRPGVHNTVVHEVGSLIEDVHSVVGVGGGCEGRRADGDGGEDNLGGRRETKIHTFADASRSLERLFCARRLGRVDVEVTLLSRVCSRCRSRA